MHSFSRVLLLSVCALTLLPNHFSSSASEFPELYNSEPDKSLEPMPAAEAAKAFQVPEGFEVTVFASEPEVQNPIDITWDNKGRLWVAENYTYSERSVKFDLSLRDRVVILADTDRDGVADKRTVFTDQVQMLTGLEVGHGGLWLMCCPQLLYFPDANGDDIPDGPAQVILDGFEVAKENYHNFANGLRWGPDGWLYGRCGGSCPGRIGKPGTPADQRVPLEGGLWRMHPQTHQFEVLSHGTTNPWGHDWNAKGDGFFINTVNEHFWQIIPGAHLPRPFTLDPNPSVYELIPSPADHWHFDTGKAWHESRSGSANDYGGGHAHCGMLIYQADQWPAEYRGRVLTLNLHGQRINQEILEADGSGYVARHAPDMLIAGDPFFRGMELMTGPEGAVYVSDWSDTGECHEHSGVHRTSGRIYRVAYKPNDKLPLPTVDLTTQSDQQLVALQNDRNNWYQRQARMELAARAVRGKLDQQAIVTLKNMLSSESTQQILDAMLTLQAIGELSSFETLVLVQHPEPAVRRMSVQLMTDFMLVDDIMGNPRTSDTQQFASQIDVRYPMAKILNELPSITSTEDAPEVLLALASTLQRIPLSSRLELATELVNKPKLAEDKNYPLLIWYGLMPVADQWEKFVQQDRGFSTEKFLTHCQLPTTLKLLSRRLAERIDEAPINVDLLLKVAIESKSTATLSTILTGLTDGLKGRSKAKKPALWDRLVQATNAMQEPSIEQMVRDLSIVFGDGRAMDEVRELVQDSKADTNLRLSALVSLVKSNHEDVVSICLPLLKDPRFNVPALEGVSRSRDPKVAQELVKAYRRFRAPNRPKVIAVLSSRAEFAEVLMNAVGEKKIPADDLTAYDVRQIRSLGNSQLQQKVTDLWGEVRETSEAKHQQMEKVRKLMSQVDESKVDLSQGRLLFDQKCTQCHKLYGIGKQIGPDLTGANRTNMDYLLENIIDPSAVVSASYRMSIVVLDDGRVLNGLITAQNETTLSIQTQTDLLTVEQDAILETRQTTQSPMPEGLIDTLSEEQIQQLFSYLKQPTQIPLPSEK